MYSGPNLEIYAIDFKIALERKLRRLLDPTRDTSIDLADAVHLLKYITSSGAQPLGFHQCESLDYNGHRLPVPTEAINMLRQSFERMQGGKQGIVDMVFDKEHKRWFYKNKQGQRVWVTWKLE